MLRCCLVRPFPKTFLKNWVFEGKQDWKAREVLEWSCPQPSWGPVPPHSTGKGKRCTSHQRRGQAAGREMYRMAGAAARENEAGRSKRISYAMHGVSMVGTWKASFLRQHPQDILLGPSWNKHCKSPKTQQERDKKGFVHLGLFILGQIEHQQQKKIKS